MATSPSASAIKLIDSSYKDRLFEENDSGLGSMPRELSSLVDLGGSQLACLVEDSDQIPLDNTVTTNAPSHHTHSTAQSGQTGHLLSLTSELFNLNLNAREETNRLCPDSRRMEMLERHQADMRRGGKMAQNSFNSNLCDSGNFSINPSTDIDEEEPTSEAHWHSEQKEAENAKPTAEESTVGGGSCGSESRAVPEDSNTLCMSAEQRVALYQGDADGDNWLHLSIIHGHQGLAMAIIRLAPDYMWLSFSNHLRQTPLHLAVLTGQDRLVRRLVCSGAIVDAQDMRGDTPLHIACRLGRIQTVKSLLTPVHHKEMQDNLWEIPYQRLPQDLAVYNSEGLTPLHTAVIAGQESVVQLLLKARADPNVGDAKSGRTALHLAAESGWLGLVNILARWHDVDLLKRNYAGSTAAQLALGRNLDGIAHLLQEESDETSDAESDITMTGADSDDDWWDEGME